MTNQVKAPGWFKRINSADEARAAIRDSAKGFYVVAAIQAAVSLVLGSSILIDAALYFSLALWLHRTFSRVPAVLLVGLSTVALAVTIANLVPGGAPRQGGTNIGLAIIVFGVAIRAAYAAFVLPSHEARQDITTSAG